MYFVLTADKAECETIHLRSQKLKYNIVLLKQQHLLLVLANSFTLHYQQFI